MIDINIELFKRYKPENKIKIIEGLSKEELLRITKSTVIRIIKETGEFYYGSKRNKSLKIDRKRRVGNDWNSEFEYVDYYKKEVYVGLYVQGDHTDTITSDKWACFFKSGTYYGACEIENQTKYFNYSEGDKAECIRSILLEYAYRKLEQKKK